jgi:hypothetical protein
MVTAPVPLLNVPVLATLMLLSKRVVVANAERSNDPPVLTVIVPVNVLSPVADPDTRDPETVVFPANVIAMLLSVVVPEDTLKCLNVYAPEIAAVPVVTSVFALSNVSVPPEPSVPVRLKLPEPMLSTLRAAVPVKVTPALAVSTPVVVVNVIFPPVVPPAIVSSPPDVKLQVFIVMLTVAVAVEAPLIVAAPVVANVPVALAAHVMFDWPPFVVGRLIVSDPAVMLAVPFMVIVCEFAFALAVYVIAPVTLVVDPVVSERPLDATGLAMVSAPIVTVPVFELVSVMFVGTVTVPPSETFPDPLIVRVPVPVSVTAPPPLSNVVPFAVISPPKLVTVAKLLPVLRLKTPVELTVTVLLNVLVPVALETVSVAPDATVTAPAYVIATAPIVVVPEFTLRIPNVVARLSVTVPVVLSAVPALIVTVPPALIVPVRLIVEAPALVICACAAVPLNVIPAVVVNVDPAESASTLLRPEVALPVIVIPAVENVPDVPPPTVIVLATAAPGDGMLVVPETVNVTPLFTVSLAATVDAAKVSDLIVTVVSAVTVTPELIVRSSFTPGRLPVPLPPLAAPVQLVKLAVALHVPLPVALHAASEAICH